MIIIDRQILHCELWRLWDAMEWNGVAAAAAATRGISEWTTYLKYSAWCVAVRSENDSVRFEFAVVEVYLRVVTI